MPVLCGVASSFFFGGRSILGKYFVEKGYNAYNFAMQSLFIDGFIGSVALLFYYEFSTDLITFSLFLKGTLGGLISGIGIFLINYAIAVGVAGPASAMANIAAVIQTLLAMIFLDQELNTLQILGLVVGLVGALVIAIGPDVMSKLNRMYRGKQSRKME